MCSSPEGSSERSRNGVRLPSRTTRPPCRITHSATSRSDAAAIASVAEASKHQTRVDARGRRFRLPTVLFTRSHTFSPARIAIALYIQGNRSVGIHWLLYRPGNRLHYARPDLD